MRRLFAFAVTATLWLSTSWAIADFSTSIMKPTPVDTNGVISASFPTGGQNTSYYFSVEAQPGDLLTQISYQGRAGADKQLELSLINENGKQGNWYWIHGSDPSAEGTRSFPIDKKGRQVVHLTVQGPEAGQFRVELGGTAVSGATPKGLQLHDGFSRSIFTPIPVANDGVISGPLPGTEAPTVYYFVVNAQAGELLTQISYDGRAGAHKELTLRLLGPDARDVGWYWIHGSDPKEESTRSFPIDSAGRKVLSIEVAGPANGTFRVELGGSAFVSNGGDKKAPVTTSQAGR